MNAPMTMGSVMAAEFEHEAANTRKLLGRVPWERADWRPHPKSMAMGRLAMHVAGLAGWAAGVVGADGLDLASPAAAAMVPPPTTSTEELLAFFDRNVATSRAAIAGASDESLGQTWTLRHGDRVLLSLPRAAALRGMVMNHGIHHRAQLGVYLRLNDVPIPGMYGPSADEA